MLKSMYSGISGLKAHQAKMDVIGNNIANVNTTAFKSGRVNFSEVFSQTMQGAKPPTPNGNGGTNPQQVGNGVTVATISTVHTSGSIQRTDNPNDLAIEGEGFFVIRDTGMNKFTRAGNFTMDEAGNFVTPTGAKVMGWNKQGNNEIDPYAPIEPINLSGLKMIANQTGEITFEGNLDAQMEVGDKVPYNVTIYDSLGVSHTITYEFEKTSSNNFSFNVSTNDPEVNITSGNTGSLVFATDGNINTTTINNMNLTFTNGAEAMTIASTDVVFDEDKFTQYANSSNITGRQNGYPGGELESLSIDKDGRVMGMFSNGRQDHKGTLALADFTNPAGLEKNGNSMYVPTWNSGDAAIGLAGTGERGVVSPGSLEMSNVDLSKEFTEMIVAQRGFQSNSKIITTSDEILQELVNLKR